MVQPSHRVTLFLHWNSCSWVTNLACWYLLWIYKTNIGSFSLSMESYIHFQSLKSLIRGGLSEQAREGASVFLLPIHLWGLLKDLSTGFMSCSFTLRTRWIIAIYYISGHCWLPGSGCIWEKRVSSGFCPPKFSTLDEKTLSPEVS